MWQHRNLNNEHSADLNMKQLKSNLEWEAVTFQAWIWEVLFADCNSAKELSFQVQRPMSRQSHKRWSLSFSLVILAKGWWGRWCQALLYLNVTTSCSWRCWFPTCWEYRHWGNVMFLEHCMYVEWGCHWDGHPRVFSLSFHLSPLNKQTNKQK